MLSNLVDNAIKFPAGGAVTVRVEQAAHADGQFMLTCTVTDSGIGISPDKIKRIFDPFIQADMSISRAYGGSGLGLAICHGIVTAAGGTIALESEEGSGTRVSVTLPRQRAEPVTHTPPSPSGRSRHRCTSS